jgi:two-component system, NarL family, sensor histidine kinase UhpB
VATAKRRDAGAVSTRPTRVSRSILWQVFTVNAFVFGAAVTALALSPATVHAPIRLSELIELVGGLLLTLLVDLALLALVLAPVRRLARLMNDIDPMRPGRRALVSQSQWAGDEANVLADAFNKMLDRIETERRESARRAVGAQEAERLRIARELHDEVGQTLTAVALQAERAAGDRRTSSQSDALKEIADIVHSSLDDVRRIARELRPEALDDLGLVDALISLCLRIDRQGAMKVSRELEGELPALTAEVELVVYRVAQEALTNALRHSQASQVRVLLRRSPEGGVLLSVTDDGCGLPQSLGQANGLAGMRERAILIQAVLEIISSPGEGVEVRLTLPTADVLE